MTVAPSTPNTMGVSRLTCRWVMTLSTRYFVEAGSTSPETRLTAISTNPIASSPRRGLINAQTSGRFFHAFLRFSFLEDGLSFVLVVMNREANPALGVGCRPGSCNYTATGGELRQFSRRQPRYVLRALRRHAPCSAR